jgi:opacity protein-like surface antigen
LGFQPEILYSAQGGKTKLSDLLTSSLGEDVTGGNATLNYGYLNVPLLLEFKPAKGLGILIGPQVGFLLSKSTTSDGVTVSGNTLDEAFKEQGINYPFKKLDLSLAIGVQYWITEKMHVGLRYNLGLTNSFSTTSTDVESGITGAAKGWKNGVIQIGLGYAF